MGGHAAAAWTSRWGDEARWWGAAGAAAGTAGGHEGWGRHAGWLEKKGEEMLVFRYSWKVLGQSKDRREGKGRG